MSREGFLNKSVKAGVCEGPKFGELATGCFPFNVLVSFVDIPGPSELSAALFLPVSPDAKRACGLACCMRR
jgi:hypothetical protein